MWCVSEMTPTSGIEFLVWLLIVAAIIAMLAKRLKIPTRCPGLGLLAPGSHSASYLVAPSTRSPSRLADARCDFDIVSSALVFEGSVKLDVRDLLRNSVPLLLLANVGVLLAPLSPIPCALVIRLPVLIALLFGCIISATDPISAGHLQDLRVDKRCSLIMEGESLLNDGTAVVLFGILFGAIAPEKLTVRKVSSNIS